VLRLEQQRVEAQQLFEKQKLEAQTQERQERLRWEQKKTEMELQAKREDQERQECAWRAKADEEKEEERKRSNVERAKLFDDAMRNASVRMGSDPIDAIPFFEGIEHLFDVFKAPNNSKVDLLRPYLSERAVKLLSQLDAGKLNDYNDVKRYILS
jgi:Na+-translocating ferredoxin:NAD+ oxidoreductase RnfC subunit